MSEGIDFKDELARCVVMVGLPFANPSDAELRLRMRFLEDTVAKGAGRTHYQNLCMRAVNQAIGRAIRHKRDFGAILLCDERYLKRADVHNALPQWIRRSHHSCHSFGDAFQRYSKFMRQMNAENE